MIGHGEPVRRWSRRSLIGLGLAGLAVAAGSPPAQAAPIQIGRFGFEVPATVRALDPPRAGWQWHGQFLEGGVPSIIVLARADLAGVAPEEALGLLLASGAGGGLPGLTVGPARNRTTQDGSPALRSPLGYRPASKINYRGTVMITENAGSTAILAVLGTERLTAGRADQVLDSVRWSA